MAFTNEDYTAYFQQLQSAQAATCHATRSDRMRNLQLSDAEFAKEVKVVMEERRMRTDDEPHSLPV